MMVSQHNDDNDDDHVQGQRPPRVRSAEKRRISTCRFADRVAELSVQHYNSVIPNRFRIKQKYTCLATVVAAIAGSEGRTDNDEDGLVIVVLGLGVGTKFLPESILGDSAFADAPDYGDRVRDCHAEVLARRAFRRYLTLEMLRCGREVLGSDQPRRDGCAWPRILEPLVEGDDAQRRFRLRDGVTLHMYCSSAPCGNSVLKKFATLHKELYRHDLRIDEWPTERHAAHPGHAQPLGQFALLCKKDHGALNQRESHGPVRQSSRITGKEATWPCHNSDAWCPAGTTTVWSGAGSLHTCSDKLGRWNCLGLQGSLLASRLHNPLYLSTVTVGRKLTAVTCRRAVCCRFGPDVDTTATRPTNTTRGDFQGISTLHPKYCLHHPAIMGTSVYMDEHGVIDMSSTQQLSGDDDSESRLGQDVRFHSFDSWVWWPGLHEAEGIDGSTGYRLVLCANLDHDDACDDASAVDIMQNQKTRSSVSTSSLLELFLQLLVHHHEENAAPAGSHGTTSASSGSLQTLRRFKWRHSEDYERVKQLLFQSHPVLKHWKCRAGSTPSKDSRIESPSKS